MLCLLSIGALNMGFGVCTCRHTAGCWWWLFLHHTRWAARMFYIVVVVVICTRQTEISHVVKQHGA